MLRLREERRGIEKESRLCRMSARRSDRFSPRGAARMAPPHGIGRPDRRHQVLHRDGKNIEACSKMFPVRGKLKRKDYSSGAKKYKGASIDNFTFITLIYKFNELFQIFRILGNLVGTHDPIPYLYFSTYN